MNQSRYPIALPPDQVYAMLKDPSAYPEWSMMIDAVEPQTNGSWSAITMMGPIPFTWQCHDAERRVEATYQALGMSILSRFGVEAGADSDSAIITVDFPHLDGAEEGVGISAMLQGMIEQDLQNFTQWAGAC
ncbi:SRPBCC family protein [Chrysiogenes arsenatis]|uniref:SRPBCC family protein n=1 Tax=Chrysiogenes arsenatis TaxID=309797 RepID=UPI000401C9FF|nr:SRPBCC family protein [Chrysiogenes arsenatis]